MNTNRRRTANVAVVSLIGIGLMATASPATAASSATPVKGDAKVCVATPASWNITTVAASTHPEQRWLRNLPGQEKKSYEATKYQHTVAGQKVYDRWKYSELVEGLDKIAHNEHQFTRTNPGQAESSHKVYQFSRTNPGQAEKTRTEYKYSKDVPPVMETKYKKPVVKTEHKYEKFVQGVVEVKEGHRWVSTGSTFTWEIWPNNPPKWSTDDKAVLESGPHHATLVEWTEGGRQYRKVTSDYQYQNVGKPRTVNTGEFTYEWFASDPGSPWVSTGTTQVKTPGSTLYYNDGNWTTDVNPAGWTKIDERTEITQHAIAPFEEYRAQDGSATTDVNNAGSFKEESFEGWVRFGEPKEVGNNDAIAPFPEYRAQDGSATTDVNNAGWFEESSFDGWTSFGEPKEVVTQQPTNDQTFFLTKDAQGNLGRSTNGEEASWFTSNTGVDLEVWTEFGREKVTEPDASLDKVIYLTMNDEGKFGYSTSLEGATWFPLDFVWPVLTDVGSIWEEMVAEQGNPLIDPSADLSHWAPVSNADGTQLVKEFVTQEAIAASTVYYVPGGQPTSALGESNWTIDSPAGWTFVDKRIFTDKAESSTKTIVPATTKPCALPPVKTIAAPPAAPQLAETGSDAANLAGLAAGLVALGAAGVAVRSRRNTRNETAAADTTQSI